MTKCKDCKALLGACKMALIQIKQDNNERLVPDSYRGIEWKLKGAIAKAEGRDEDD